jgi:deoxyribodipyrimidine photo-lyase
MINTKRVKQIKEVDTKDGPIIYWMSQDQRVHDNWALLYAQEIAIKKNQKLFVVFCLVKNFLEATICQYDFLLNGLQIVFTELCRHNIPFHLLFGSPEIEILKFIKENRVGILITDFDPLKIKR